jgi:hypothetical protein
MIQAGQPIVASDFIDESAGAGDVGKVPKLNDDGVLSTSFFSIFGDGSDGDVTISTPTTLTRDMYYNNLTVNDVLTTNGYRIFVKETIDGSGTIDWGIPNDGGNGVNSSTDTLAVGGAGGAQGGAGLLKNVAGANGATATNAGNAGTSVVSSIGVAGSAGGQSGPGASGSVSLAGGVAGSVTKPINQFGYNLFLNLAMMDLKYDGTFTRLFSSAGSGGGASSQRGTGGGSGSGATHSGGGGGGASGGIVFICARFWEGTFTIKSIGGDGGNGANVTGSFSTGINGPGGGGGGAGGVSVVFFGTKTWSGSYNLAGGTGGTGGTGSGSGVTGQNGANGVTGVSYEISAI